MSNETGRGSGSWPEERPPRASVRHLYADEAEGSSATATEEWYETERFAGQIIGGARTAPLAFPRGEAPGVLGWRHAELVPAPTALQRLGRSLADCCRRVASLFVATGHRSRQLDAADGRDPDASAHKQARRRRLTMLTTRRVVAPPTVESREDRPSADEVLAAEPSSPRTAPRGAAQLLDWRSAPAPKARRARRPRPSRRALVGAALALTTAAVAVIAITSHTNGPGVTPDQASFATAMLGPGVGVVAAARTVLGALGEVEHQAWTTPARHRINARRAHPRSRLHHDTRHRHSRPAAPHTSSPAPQAPAASHVSSSAGGGGALSTAGSTSQASAAPASSSQSTSSAQAPSQRQPAGPTGAAAILGPGQCSC